MIERLEARRFLSTAPGTTPPDGNPGGDIQTDLPEGDWEWGEPQAWEVHQELPEIVDNQDGSDDGLVEIGNGTGWRHVHGATYVMQRHYLRSEWRSTGVSSGPSAWVDADVAEGTQKAYADRSDVARVSYREAETDGKSFGASLGLDVIPDVLDFEFDATHSTVTSGTSLVTRSAGPGDRGAGDRFKGTLYKLHVEYVVREWTKLSATAGGIGSGPFGPNEWVEQEGFQRGSYFFKSYKQERFPEAIGLAPERLPSIFADREIDDDSEEGVL